MNPANQGAWLSWFANFETDEAIRSAAYVSGKPINDIERLSPEVACEALDAAWREVFVPGPQHVQILRSMLERSRVFAMSKYPTFKDYNLLRYTAGKEVGRRPPITCLTGLAGVSKSSVVQAFERICRVAPTDDNVAQGERLVIAPVRRLVIDGQPAIHNILKSLANPVAVMGRTMNQMAGLMAHVSDWLVATATSTLIVDEMQFFTQSSTASTKTSQLIMTMANLGVPLVYVANYSLVRKLMLRPQEEKDRLLAMPVILAPPDAEDAWWRACIKAYLEVSPGAFTLSSESDAQELHRLTAGLLRGLRRLLSIAYLEARAKDRYTVTMEDVRQAYRSRSYSSARRDVEDLMSLTVSRFMAEKRPDLVCPFAEQSSGGPTLVSRSGSSASGQRPISVRDTPIAMLESSLCTEAKKTLREVRRAANLPKDERITAKVTHLHKRDPINAQSLLDGAEVLRKVIRRPPSVPKSRRGEGDGA